LYSTSTINCNSTDNCNLTYSFNLTHKYNLTYICVWTCRYMLSFISILNYRGFLTDKCNLSYSYKIIYNWFSFQFRYTFWLLNCLVNIGSKFQHKLVIKRWMDPKTIFYNMGSDIFCLTSFFFMLSESAFLLLFQR